MKNFMRKATALIAAAAVALTAAADFPFGLGLTASAEDAHVCYDGILEGWLPYPEDDPKYDTYHQYQVICDGCPEGNSTTEDQAHVTTNNPATCSFPAMCELCNAYVGDVDADNHNTELTGDGAGQHASICLDCTEPQSDYVDCTYVSGVCTECGTPCAHDLVTDGVCEECSSAMGVRVSKSDGTSTLYASVEEALSALNTECTGITFLSSYTGDISLSDVYPDFTISSEGETPCTVTGNIAIDSSVGSAALSNLTVTGTVTCADGVTVTVEGGFSADTVSAYHLTVNGGTIGTVNAYGPVFLKGGTVTDVNECGENTGDIGLYAGAGVTGTITLKEGSFVYINEVITNPVIIDAALGQAANITAVTESGEAVAALITSADGYNVAVDGSYIVFECHHPSYTDGVCDECEAVCTHTSVGMVDNAVLCADCGAEILAGVWHRADEESDPVVYYYETVEEAVEKVNNSSGQVMFSLVSEYTDDIVINSPASQLSISGAAPIAGDITVTNSGEDVQLVQMQAITVNGNVTAGENVGLQVDGDVVIDGNLTVAYMANISEGTVNNVFVEGTEEAPAELYICEDSVVTGTVTLSENAMLIIDGTLTTAVTVDAPLGPVAKFYSGSVPAAFDLKKIVSADGYKVILNEYDEIEFVCEHENMTEGECADCGNTYEAVLIAEDGTETYYEDVKDAAWYAEDYGTVKLLRDITLGEGETPIRFADTIAVLDMNGYDITAEGNVAVLVAFGDLTVKGNGKITAAGFAASVEMESVVILGGTAPALTGGTADIYLYSSAIYIEESVSVYNNDVYSVIYQDSEDNPTGVFATATDEVTNPADLFTSYHGYDIYETYNVAGGVNICLGELVDITVNGVTYSCVVSEEEMTSYSGGANNWLAHAYPATVYGYEGVSDDSFAIFDGESKTVVFSNYTGDGFMFEAENVETVSVVGENAVTVYLTGGESEETAEASVTGGGSLTDLYALGTDLTIGENVEINGGLVGSEGAVITNNGTVKVTDESCVTVYGGAEDSFTLTGDGEFIFTAHPDSCGAFKFAEGAKFTYDGTDLTEKIKAMVVTDNSFTVEYMGIDWKLEADLDNWSAVITDGEAESSDAAVTPVDAGDYKLWFVQEGVDYGSLDFTIDPADIAKAEVTFVSCTYNGSEQTVSYTVYLNGSALTEGSDYTVSGTITGTEAGEYTAVITGMGNYTGTKEVKWIIDKFAADSFIWSEVAEKTYDGTTDYISSNTYAYLTNSETGGRIDLKLDSNSSIKIEFADPNAGYDKEYTVTITLSEAIAKNFTQSVFTYTAAGGGMIYPKYLESVTIVPEKAEYDYTGEEIKPAVTVKDGDTVIPADQYVVEYYSNIDAGTAEIQVYGAEGANYWFNSTAYFTINKVKATVTEAPTANELTYTGEAQELVGGGTPNGGIFMYSLTGEEDSFTVDIPTGTDAGKYIVYYYVLGDDNHTDSETGSVAAEITKADPEYTLPEGLTATYGDTLADVELPEGFAWADDTQSVGNAGINTVKAVYTPADTANYNTLTIDVTITVGKAPAPEVKAPTATGILNGQTLASSVLSDTAWQWVDKTIVPEVGTGSYEAYVTVDGANYDYSAVDGYNAEDGTVTRLVEVTVEADSLIGSFVERLYTELLGRASDKNGKAKWVAQLESGKTAAEIAEKFVLSNELKGQKLTNSEFVTRMYEALLDRTPSAKEVTRWAATLDNGCSYAYILKGFTASAEFGKLCAKYGITAGTYVPTENRDRNEKLTAFVSRMYTKVLGRSYDVTGLNNHTGRYLRGEKTAAQIAQSFFFSAELKNKNLSDEEFLARLYAAMFNRNPDQGGKSRWLQKMADGMTREQVFSGFANSAEFKNFVKNAGID